MATHGCLYLVVFIPPPFWGEGGFLDWGVGPFVVLPPFSDCFCLVIPFGFRLVFKFYIKLAPPSKLFGCLASAEFLWLEGLVLEVSPATRSSLSVLPLLPPS